MIPPALAAFLLRWGVVAAVGISLLGYGYYRGHASAMADWRATEAKAERVALEATMNMERKGAQEVVRYVTKTKVIHEQIESVPLAVTPEDDVKCALPADFGRLWNESNKASAAPTAPDSHATPDPASVAGIEAGRRGAATIRH